MIGPKPSRVIELRPADPTAGAHAPARTGRASRTGLGLYDLPGVLPRPSGRNEGRYGLCGPEARNHSGLSIDLELPIRR
jgi:hypothetical protein